MYLCVCVCFFLNTLRVDMCRDVQTWAGKRGWAYRGCVRPGRRKRILRHRNLRPSSSGNVSAFLQFSLYPLLFAS